MAEKYVNKALEKTKGLPRCEKCGCNVADSRTKKCVVCGGKLVKVKTAKTAKPAPTE